MHQEHEKQEYGNRNRQFMKTDESGGNQVGHFTLQNKYKMLL